MKCGRKYDAPSALLVAEKVFANEELNERAQVHPRSLVLQLTYSLTFTFYFWRLHLCSDITKCNYTVINTNYYLRISCSYTEFSVSCGVIASDTS